MTHYNRALDPEHVCTFDRSEGTGDCLTCHAQHSCDIVDFGPESNCLVCGHECDHSDIEYDEATCLICGSDMTEFLAGRAEFLNEGDR